MYCGCCLFIGCYYGGVQGVERCWVFILILQEREMCRRLLGVKCVGSWFLFIGCYYGGVAGRRPLLGGYSSFTGA